MKEKRIRRTVLNADTEQVAKVIITDDLIKKEVVEEPIKSKIGIVKEKIDDLIKEEVVEEKVEITPLPEKELKPIRTSPPSSSRKVQIRPKLEYRVLRGSFRIFGISYKKNDKFFAYPEEIPNIFMEKLICVSNETTKALTIEDPDKPNTKENLYVVRKTRSPGWFEVINVETGKSINEKSLRRSSAETLCNSLNL